MYYIYIIYSPSADKYYIGYTTDIKARLEKHNHQESFNTYTRKYRPWVLKGLFLVGENEKEAIRIERFIKKQKSRAMIEKLIDPYFVPDATLAQLVRVPHMRD
ncbi:MAG: GIY-YIG nuclease family protein [Agriterribacter sp.]